MQKMAALMRLLERISKKLWARSAGTGKGTAWNIEAPQGELMLRKRSNSEAAATDRKETKTKILEKRGSPTANLL